MRKNLTDLFVQNVRQRGDHRADYLDTSDPGLVLRVSPSGVKSWSYLYKVPGEGGLTRTGKPRKGRQHRMTLGNYPMVSLGEAREKVRDLKTSVGQGVDPRVEAMVLAKSKADNTVDLVGQRMYQRVLDEGVLKRPDKIESALRLYIYPHLGQKPISEVTRGDVKALIARFMKLQKPSAADAAKKYMSRIFNFALDEEIIDRNPIDGLKRGHTQSKKDRILEDEELVAAWQAADNLGYPWGDAVKLLMLTGCRKREITWAKWSEIKSNERALVIPSDRYKTDQTLMVPMSDTAWSVLQAISREGEYIFSANGGESPINSDTYLKRHLTKRLPDATPPWTLHDLRRTLRTNLPRLGISGEIAERVLGHGPKDKIEGIYNLYGYADEKRDALQRYDDFLRGLTNDG